ncbi:MAG: hypothetical protein FWF94_06590 [Oscillospiraceae bacterium]|nr:hypothetical protein [Oscillospiraceae bacterium]
MTVEIKPPKQVVEILEKLESHGYSAYIHGECVRVLIKGQTHLDEIKAFDFDVMTNAEMSRILAIFEDYGLNCENVARGELIVTVLGVAVSITTMTEIKDELSNEHAFTFDAIAYSLKSGLVDPWGGLNDLKKGCLNFIQVGKAFNPHDILPALAWRSSGDFEISDFAKGLIHNNISDMAKPSYVKESQDAKNLKAILTERNVNAVLSEYEDVFAAIIPEIKMLGENAEHSYKCVGCSAPVLTLRYALLFHELGKEDCRSVDSNGNNLYYGHAERSRIYAERIMTRLGCPAEDIKETGLIIKNYQRVAHTSRTLILDLKDEFPNDLLKLLLLFNCAINRAVSNEKDAMMFKELSKGM